MQSKLGIHVNAWTVPNEILTFIAKAQPRILKVLDFNLELIARAKQLAPDMLIIGRKYVPTQPFEDDPVGYAQLFCEQHLFPLAAKMQGLIDAWEGYNETGHGNSIAAYAQFEAARVRCLARQGLRAVVGNFATGTPELDQHWQAFLPALYEAKANGGYLGLHEYSAPFMQWMTGKNQVNPNEDQGDEGWTTLRYRKVYRHMLPDDLKELPLLITECGIDGGVYPRPGPPGGGWRDFEEFNIRQGPGDYLSQLMWYDAELQRDNFVQGAAIFCFGTQDPHWNSWDIRDYSARIADYMSSLGGKTHMWQPQPRIAQLLTASTDKKWIGRPAGPPSWIILHDTAGGDNWTAERWINYIQTTWPVSAHYIIMRDGTVIQAVDPDDRAWHAGSGKLPGYTGNPNNISIGIEFIQSKDDAQVEYPDTQLDAGVAILQDLVRRYPSLAPERVAYHREIDPARRRDPRGFDEYREAFVQAGFAVDPPAPSAEHELDQLFDGASGTLTHIYRRDLNKWVWRVEHERLLPAKVYGFSMNEVIDKLRAKLG